MRLPVNVAIKRYTIFRQLLKNAMVVHLKNLKSTGTSSNYGLKDRSY